MLPHAATLCHLNDQRLRELRAERERDRLAAKAAPAGSTPTPALVVLLAALLVLAVVAAFAPEVAHAGLATSPSGSRP